MADKWQKIHEYEKEINQLDLSALRKEATRLEGHLLQYQADDRLYTKGGLALEKYEYLKHQYGAVRSAIKRKDSPNDQ